MPTPPRRWSRVVGYLLMAAGGGTAFAIPAPAIERATGWAVYLWAAFLLTGGLLCGWGAFTDRWIGELAGLPLISAAFAVYGGVLLLGRQTVSATAGALAFAAVALILFARWRDVDLVRVEATRAADERNEAAQ